jgi:hypothetical protein
LGWERSKTFDNRSLLVGGKDQSGSDRRTPDRSSRGSVNRSETSTSTSTLPPRRNVQRDTPPPSNQNVDRGGSEVKRQTPPPSQSIGGQRKSSDTPSQPERKAGTPRTDFSTQERRGGDMIRKPDKTITPPGSKSSQLPTDAQKKIDDARRRLGGGKGVGDAIPPVERRGKEGVLSGQETIKSGQTKTIPPGLKKPLDKSMDKPGMRTAIDSKPPRDANKARFSDQLKAGELKRLTAGETAQKIKLADQYKLHQQGDVARRLDLQKHSAAVARQNYAANIERFRHADVHRKYVHHPNFYHGVVNPVYARHCIRYHYWGPTFFAGLCWYPQWTSWVAWSWHHHCHPWWDPRPNWCRPVFYDPSPAWVYWETPVWTPLPVVACGTWVDLKPAIVAAAEWDLQLAAVRFVDPGHPEEKLGPRYRVWFRNNSRQPIAQPFNVMLFASNDGRLLAGLPQAGVRVTAAAPGDIQSVDIRLPADVLTMNRDEQGNPAPFAALHVLVDAGQEIREIVRTNNGATLKPAEILPVDPAAFDLQPTAAKPGSEVILAGEGLGPEPGQLLVHVGGRELQGEILGWYDLGVRWTVPNLVVAAPTEAEVIVVRGDGAATNPLKITISP